jgi:hypothetical protein
MIGVEKLGISIIKESTFFASKVDRFNPQNVKRESLPGPGAYD